MTSTGSHSHGVSPSGSGTIIIGGLVVLVLSGWLGVSSTGIGLHSVSSIPEGYSFSVIFGIITGSHTSSKSTYPEEVSSGVVSGTVILGYMGVSSMHSSLLLSMISGTPVVVLDMSTVLFGSEGSSSGTIGVSMTSIAGVVSLVMHSTLI